MLADLQLAGDLPRGYATLPHATRVSSKTAGNVANTQGSIAFPFWSRVMATSLDMLAHASEGWLPCAEGTGHASTFQAGMGRLVTRGSRRP